MQPKLGFTKIWQDDDMVELRIEACDGLTTTHFVEFPDHALQANFDAPDRKFAAVAHAHPNKPAILQAADCKWLDWWPALKAKSVGVEFLCAEDACGFYSKKFPNKPVPALPG